MPALPATPVGVIKFTLSHALEDDTSIGNHFDMSYTGPAPTTAQLSAFAVEVGNMWSDNMPPLFSSDGLLDGVYASDLANPSTVKGFGVSGVAGTRTGSMSDISRCSVVVFHPDRAYRGSRPRLMLPYGTDSDVTGGNAWSTSFTADLLIAWNAFLANLNGLSQGSTNLTNPAAVSYYQGFTVVTSPTTHRARNVPTLRDVPLVVGVVDVTVRQLLGSQRRRITAS